ncbi:MAG: hypothetical protein M1565_08725 [Actinobacteria bacterium]|nr:hypothetical protein [Actinomycetota bacterium]
MMGMASVVDWLADIIFDDSQRFTILPGVNLLQDGGIRTITPSNAGGGSWFGDYRYFVVEDAAGNHEVVSISIMASEKFDNHPRFGTRAGVSTLVVAVDDLEKRHNSLQLSLDRYAVLTTNGFRIEHDGRLTLGKRGAAKRDEVLRFVQGKAPHLFENGKVMLADIDFKAKGQASNSQAQDMISRLIQYALLRDDFRRSRP